MFKGRSDTTLECSPSEYHSLESESLCGIIKVRKGKKFYIADPGKGLIKYNLDEFKSHWISTKSDGEEKGIAMFLEPTPAFYSHKADEDNDRKGKDDNPRSFRFLFG